MSLIEHSRLAPAALVETGTVVFRSVTACRIARVPKIVGTVIVFKNRTDWGGKVIDERPDESHVGPILVEQETEWPYQSQSRFVLPGAWPFAASC